MKNRIRILRAEKGWSQADLAERVQVSRNSINAIENGKFDPSLLESRRGPVDVLVVDGVQAAAPD